ncbi:4a-hydroxytetrahydrobiopterin dehydratase [Actinokineospora baliensis]|uniref:4a-hydroxytetrahydrobiopterin dehydratase n=1 Tax=Actinokineospora baliensis TaxID=547056 RepID=UPI00195D260F|nr:4a-hydroxytetrahydrobiopterin dehydratase [Actinokineospora baliensis]MBM7771996.1 4a-hydroxytetrahydrobiopterin dehydratase [Actinokineospora baliensis]
MAELLSDQEIGKTLGTLPRWRLNEGGLVRVAELADFAAAMAVVNRVADLAEAADHHPDIDIRWNKVTFRCTTHSANGITAKDAALATQIEAVLA